jgi:hypothetical protein
MAARNAQTAGPVVTRKRAADVRRTNFGWVRTVKLSNINNRTANKTANKICYLMSKAIDCNS